MIGIYQITNPNGKAYIGKATNWNKRQNDYKSLNCKKQPKIYRSLLKYGVENHVYELIKKCTKKQLDKFEVYYKQQFINQFGWENALFCEIYDIGGGPKSNETKLKMSNSQKGLPKPKPEDFGEKHSKRMKGRKYTKEHCENISKANKGKKRTKEQNEYLSSITKGIPKPKGFSKKLSKLLKGKKRGSYKTNKPILQFDKQGNFIKEWESQTLFCKYYKVGDGWVNNCLTGRSKSIKGFILKYKNG